MPAFLFMKISLSLTDQFPLMLIKAVEVLKGIGNSLLASYCMVGDSLDINEFLTFGRKICLNMSFPETILLFLIYYFLRYHPLSKQWLSIICELSESG